MLSEIVLMTGTFVLGVIAHRELAARPADLSWHLPPRPWTAARAEEARVRLRIRQAEELTTVYNAQSAGLKIPMGLMQSLHQKHAAEWAELELTAATDVGVTV